MSTQLLHEQFNFEETMLKDFEKGNYTIENPMIVKDPYNLNPLSAYFLFKTEKEVAITVNVKGKKKIADVKQTFPQNTVHILPIIGLHLNGLTTVEVSIYQGKTYTHVVETQGIEFDETIVIDFEANPLILENKLLIYSTPTTFFKYHLPFGLDCLGEVRWLLSKPFNWDFRQLQNGRIMVGTGDMIEHPYYVSGLYEIDWMAKIHVFYEIDTFYHHDFIEMNDNELLVLTDQKDVATTEDALVVFNRQTGEVVKRWNYQDFIDPTKTRQSGSWSERDWAHNNAVWYDKYSNSITLSCRHMDTILNVDYETSKLKWILSDPKGWDQEYVDQYFLKPQGYNFEYTYGQHAVAFNEHGEMYLFDNHYKGKKHPEYVKPKDSFSRGVRFKINPEDRTVETTWQFGKDLGTHVYSPYISFVDYFTDDHNLIHFGGTGFENGVASEYHGPKGHERDVDMESQTFEIAYGRQLLHAHVKGNYYRARKLLFKHTDYQFNHYLAKHVHIKD